MATSSRYWPHTLNPHFSCVQGGAGCGCELQQKRPAGRTRSFVKTFSLRTINKMSSVLLGRKKLLGRSTQNVNFDLRCVTVAHCVTERQDAESREEREKSRTVHQSWHTHTLFVYLQLKHPFLSSGTSPSIVDSYGIPIWASERDPNSRFL